MANYAFLLDLARCVTCQACVAACKTGNELPFGTQYIKIRSETQGTFPNLQTNILHKRCFHCSDAACVNVCPTGALFKEDGMTRLDRSACSGCNYCVEACPYDIPEMVDGLSAKCDGCAAAVKAGGQPWCVKTCPSDALRYDERETILAEAQSRVEALKERYPKAQIYGETQTGGLGVIMVLPNDPETLDLPPDPKYPLTAASWQKVVQPASVGLTSLSIAVTGLAAIIARRNHKRELEHLHEQAAASSDNSGSNLHPRTHAFRQRSIRGP